MQLCKTIQAVSCLNISPLWFDTDARIQNSHMTQLYWYISCPWRFKHLIKRKAFWNYNQQMYSLTAVATCHRHRGIFRTTTACFEKSASLCTYWLQSTRRQRGMSDEPREADIDETYHTGMIRHLVTGLHQGLLIPHNAPGAALGNKTQMC